MNATHEGQDAADVLERAADEMERRGKANGTYCDDGAVCVYGALCIAHGVAVCEQSARDLPSNLYRPLMRFLSTDYRHEVAMWNDANDAPTVIAGLRAVAATLRAQQAAPVAEQVCAELES